MEDEERVKRDIKKMRDLVLDLNDQNIEPKKELGIVRENGRADCGIISVDDRNLEGGFRGEIEWQQVRLEYAKD